MMAIKLFFPNAIILPDSLVTIKKIIEKIFPKLVGIISTKKKENSVASS